MKKYLIGLLVATFSLCGNTLAYQPTDADTQLLAELDRAIVTLAVDNPASLAAVSVRIDSLLATLAADSRAYYILRHIADQIEMLPDHAFDFSLESLGVGCAGRCLAVVVCGAGDFSETQSLLSVDVSIVNHTARVTAPYADYGHDRCQSYLFDFHDDLQLDSPGIYDIVVSADPNDLFGEMDENNNTVRGQIPLDPNTDRNTVIWFSK